MYSHPTQCGGGGDSNTPAGFMLQKMEFSTNSSGPLGSKRLYIFVLHFTSCRLKILCYLFPQNRNGHALLWSEYMKARQQDTKTVFFKEVSEVLKILGDPKK